MQSASFRTLTGAIVTALVVILIILIGTTLLRFPLNEAGGGAASDTVPVVAAQAGVIVAPDGGASAPGMQPTFTPTPLADGAAATGADGAEGPEFGLTLEPTPTRHREVGADEPSTESVNSGSVVEPTRDAMATRDPTLLPLPDPGMPPTATLEFFANANEVRDVVFADGSFWSATNLGAVRWDVDTAIAEIAGIEQGLGSVRLSSAVDCPLEDFGLVFGSDAGLQVLDSETGTWRQITSGGAAIRHRDVSALACDTTQGLVVVGYAEHGIDIFRERQGRWGYVERSQDVAPQGVTALAIGKGGVVWVASRGALASINGTIVEAFDAGSSPLTGEEITALAVDDGGALWITAGDRLYRYAEDTWEVFSDNRVTGDFPAGLLADVQPAAGGRVWVAGASGEICRFDPELQSCSSFYSGEEGMAAGPVRDLAVGNGALLGYGTAAQGSSLLNRSRWSSLTLAGGLPASNRIFALASDANGFLWTATGAGVQQADPAKPNDARLIDAKQSGAPTAVRTLFADGRGGIWLGGQWASYFDGATWTHFTQATGLVGDEVTAIAEDAQGRIWFGTPVGLSIWTGTTFFNLTGENGLPNGEILSLAADAEGMWIGSAAGGLYRFENNRLQVLTAENVGLPSDRITALLAGGDGSLYVGTDAGLAQFASGALTAVEATSEQPVNSLAASPDGSIWVGTEGAGTWVQRDGEWQFVDLDRAALPTDVRALAIDLYGGAWIGSDTGLVRIAPTPQ